MLNCSELGVLLSLRLCLSLGLRQHLGVHLQVRCVHHSVVGIQWRIGLSTGS